jgi:hypothetical protein
VSWIDYYSIEGLLCVAVQTTVCLRAADAWRAAGTSTGLRVKVLLTVGQIVRLLCIGGRRILLSVQSVNEYAHMNSTNLITRVAQGFLAVTATGVSVLLLQFAMVA